MDRIIKAVVLSPFVRQRLVAFLAKPNKEDLQSLKELIEAGEVAPVIDRTYPLGQSQRRFGYVEEGHARGKVVISV